MNWLREQYDAHRDKFVQWCIKKAGTPAKLPENEPICYILKGNRLQLKWGKFKKAYKI